MNESVVITFLLLFVTNFILSTIYLEIVPEDRVSAMSLHHQRLPLASLDSLGAASRSICASCRRPALDHPLPQGDPADPRRGHPRVGALAVIGGTVGVIPAA